jgi:dTDP-glucose pyrophosphorylase
MNQKKEIELLVSKYSIDLKSNIHNALEKMNNNKSKLLLVLKANKFYSLLSIGDIQRALIHNIKVDRYISDILRSKSKIKISKEGDSIEEIKKLMLEYRIEFMPVIDNKKNITNILFWNEIFNFDKKIEQKLINIPVVIMAGGKGTRLKPLTNVLPKPLLPINNEPILTTIINTFKKSGSKDFYISVNYMHEAIRLHYENNKDEQIDLFYIKEDKPLGTAGSISLLKDKINSTFFISNCDIIIDQDYGDVLEYHKSNGNLITIVGALKKYSIPYGTLEIAQGGSLKNISEKPELNYVINTGVYVIEPQVIGQIPENKFFHITHLIEKIKLQKGKVGVYPVSDNSWTDIGEMDSYLNILKQSKD